MVSCNDRVQVRAPLSSSTLLLVALLSSWGASGVLQLVMSAIALVRAYVKKRMCITIG